MNLCRCGCGIPVQKNYKRGHGRRGKHNSKEHNLRIIMANRTGHFIFCLTCKNRFYIQKSALKKGKKFCCKKCYSKYQKGKPLSKKHIQNSAKARMGHPVSEETRQKIGEKNRGKKNGMFGKYHPVKIKEEIGKCSSQMWKKHPEYKERLRLCCLKMLQERYKPNKFEKRIIRLIKQNQLPWKYIGDGREGRFFGKVPDFINTNNEKKIAEAYEDYWKTKNYGSAEKYKKTRTNHFKKFGFKIVFIHFNDSDKEIIEKLT